MHPINIAADHEIMDTSQRDIDGSAFDQPAIVGIDYRLDDLVLEINFLTAVWRHLQGIQ